MVKVNEHHQFMKMNTFCEDTNHGWYDSSSAVAVLNETPAATALALGHLG